MLKKEQQNEKRPRIGGQETKKQNVQYLKIPDSYFKNARDAMHVYDSVIENFEWPEFKTHSERIKSNTEKYYDCSITDAFSIAYGKKLKSRKSDLTPVGSVRVGDVISLKIKSVDKKGVIFNSDMFKEEIVSAVNLFQYKRFKENIPSKEVLVKVVEKTESKIVVDPLAPLYDKWIEEHTTNLGLQKDMNDDKYVTVSNLQLVKGFNNRGGGYYGSIRIDNVSDFLGQDVHIKGFVPGSQIVLNIENDFERWNGETVKCFIISYDKSAISSGKAGIVCSVKERLKFHGDKKKIAIFKEYTEDSEKWKAIAERIFEGSITGVIHSANKCGAFVEIPELNITGIINCEPDELVNFKRGENVKVRWTRFDENVYFNKDMGQMQHASPYVIENNILKSCHLKAIFEVVK